MSTVNARLCGERGQHRPEQPIARVSVAAVEPWPVDLETERGRQVAQRAERTRRRQGVARCPQDSGRAGEAGDKLVNEGGLADAGLAADEDHAPVPGRGVPPVVIELCQVRFALDQVHSRRIGMTRPVSSDRPRVAPSEGMELVMDVIALAGSGDGSRHRRRTPDPSADDRC